MSLSSTLPDPWIGKLVWFFPRDNKGLPIGNSALCGIVINRLAEDIYAIMYQGERVYTWSADMEEVEDWDENSEGENGSKKTQD